MGRVFASHSLRPPPSQPFPLPAAPAQNSRYSVTLKTILLINSKSSSFQLSVSAPGHHLHEPSHEPHLHLSSHEPSQQPITALTLKPRRHHWSVVPTPGSEPMKDTTLPGSLKLCPSSGLGPSAQIRSPGRWDADTEGPEPTEGPSGERTDPGKQEGSQEAGVSPLETPVAHDYFKTCRSRGVALCHKRKAGPGRTLAAGAAYVGRHSAFSHDFQLITDAVAASPSENHPNHHRSDRGQGEGCLP